MKSIRAFALAALTAVAAVFSTSIALAACPYLGNSGPGSDSWAMVSALNDICANAGSAPAGSATAAKQDTGNASLATIATNTGLIAACSLTGVQSAASTNATNIKGSAGTWCGGKAINTTGTIYYLRLYNLASAPTCSSATGFVATIPVPASTAGAGTDLSLGPFGAAFGTGIGFCLTGGGTSTDNTNAATGVFLSITYK